MQRGLSRSSALLMIAVFLSLTFVSAAELNIVTRNPGYGLVIRVKEPGTLDIIDSIYSRTNETNGIAHVSYSTNRPELAYTIMIVNQGTVLESKDFGPLSTSGTQELRLVPATEAGASAPSSTTNTTNVTTNTTTTTPASTSSSNTSNATVVTGNVVASNASSSGFNYYWIGAAVIGVFVILMIVQRARLKLGKAPKAPHETAEHNRPRTRRPTVPKTLAPASPTQPGVTPASAAAMPSGQLDQRIQSLEQEIERLRKQERIVEAEKRFEQAKQDLDHLRTEQERRDSQTSFGS